MSDIPERYSTAGVEDDSRLAWWNNLACKTYNNLVIDAKPLSASASMTRLL